MNPANVAGPGSGLGTPDKVKNLAGQRLLFVPLKEYPYLIAPATRIMSESSPMYAMVEDCVPKKHHTAAYNMMANLRLKMVREHLTVVLRAPQDLSERNFDHVLYKLRAAPATNSPSNPRTTPLQLGPVEVVGIYTLKPPAQDKQNTDGDAPQKPPTLWERFKQTASGIMIRVYFRLFCYSCVRWGFSVPSMMFSWMGNIHSMSPHITASEIYDPKQWGLETMCIANALQGQGVGRAVVKHMQAELSKSRAPGMHGLCQSEHTKEFYVKCGFKGREVFTHQDPSPYKPGEVRKHYLVAWNV